MIVQGCSQQIIGKLSCVLRFCQILRLNHTSPAPSLFISLLLQVVYPEINSKISTETRDRMLHEHTDLKKVATKLDGMKLGDEGYEAHFDQLYEVRGACHAECIALAMLQILGCYCKPAAATPRYGVVQSHAE